ncbi:unnamed protein product, partial [Ixodes persulcatus]
GPALRVAHAGPENGARWKAGERQGAVHRRDALNKSVVGGHRRPETGSRSRHHRGLCREAQLQWRCHYVRGLALLRTGIHHGVVSLARRVLFERLLTVRCGLHARQLRLRLFAGALLEQ